MTRTYHPRGELVDGYRARKHPSYTTWAQIHSRCSDPNQSNYKNYGGRGINVCERWNHFKNFVADMGIKPSWAQSIDRIDNNGDYEPLNCRWADRKTQNCNKGVYATSKTGVTGIRIRDGKFQVRVNVYGKRKSIGNFNSIEEAVAARTRELEKEARRTQTRIAGANQSVQRA